jgi:hypothetical protein
MFEETAGAVVTGAATARDEFEITTRGRSGGIAPLAISRATGRAEFFCAMAGAAVASRLATSMSAERKPSLINGRGSREAPATRETVMTLKPHFGSRTISKALSENFF